MATNLTLASSGIYTILLHSPGYNSSSAYQMSLQSLTGGGCNGTPVACGQNVNAGTSYITEMDAYSLCLAGRTVIFSFRLLVPMRTLVTCSAKGWTSS